MHVSARRRRLPWQRLPLIQLMSTAVIGLLALWSGGVEALRSVLLGGAVALLPTLYFLWRGLQVRGGRRPRISVANFYQAAVGKFGLTVALFVMVFVAAPPSNPTFFFIAYVAAQSMHWLTPWLLRDRPTP
ncbi:ATP synthase protein I [Franzmannia pantelleriensis]|uniref:ATP synthase protein I n=1 Tax=Franzmannia pantelleriensis TaxID=48727 RepID=A0A1G9L5B7_9GAMM|nr:ATP synthase subunit I [Halomonas pantelleriensis]SDL57140.1 ATP synthase protein I [Halomonas pantelleriensis]